MNRHKWKKKFNSIDPNSDEPLEISSKGRPEPLMVFQPQSKILRDPRFEESSGDFNKFIFRDRFGPLIKESMVEDLKELKKIEKKEKDPEQSEKIKSLIQRTKNKIKTSESQEKERQLIQKLRSEKRKEINKSGPVYVTKAAITKAQLVEKFKKLKQSGKLSKYIEKKRKKNLGRDRKKLNRK
ncbi:ribosomal RNA processing protein 36 homolog [Panonychus citri]|uniref:ribosomal RNA processing protein 36 homolog n=1 Tax=Panonychus citri TaxID=50023 RepID=UPI002307EF83|nr:ribosomal RNA processing protein 36 homolog [Panonychus citri]